MTIRLLRSDQYVVSQWSGGITRQIAIAPFDAIYAKRDFLWRISSATVELEESQFTPLLHYDRWIAILDGEISLSHRGGSFMRLAPFVPYHFDGGIMTYSKGRCTDFNLMLRKGACQGSVRVIAFPSAGKREIPVESYQGSCSSDRTIAILIYCCAGKGMLAGDDGFVAFSADESILAENVIGSSLTLIADHPSTFIVAQINAII